MRPIPPPPSVFGPLVPRSKQSKSSRQESISSEDPTPDTGYEPSAVSDDFEDTEHRSTIRPHQFLPNIPNSFTPTSQASRYDTRQPSSPVSAKLTYTERRRLYESDFSTGTIVPTSHSLQASEDALTPRRQHVRRGSNAQEVEQALRESDRNVEYPDPEWPRNQPSPLGGFNKWKICAPRGRVGQSASDDPASEARGVRAISRDPDSVNGGGSPVARTSSGKKKPPRLDGPLIPTRPIPPPRKSGGRLAPSGHIITWKASDSSTTSTTKTLKNAKSMDVLKAVPPVPPRPLRTSPSRPHLPASPNVGPANTRPLEPMTRPRPLPPTQGPALDCVNLESNQTMRPFLQSSTAVHGSTPYLPQTQDPYPRPPSTSPSQQRYPKPVDVPVGEAGHEREVQRSHVLHQPSSSGSVSRFGETPFREDGYGGTTLPFSLRPGAGGYGGAQPRPYCPTDTPPRSPVSAASSRGASANSNAVTYTSSGTLVPSKSSAGQDTSESTLRPEERDKMIWDLKSCFAMQKNQPMEMSPQDSACSNDSYGTPTEELWSRRPFSQLIHDVGEGGFAPSPKSSPRPALNVITQNQDTNVRGVPANFPPPPNFIPQVQPPSRNMRTPRNGQKSSTPEESTWAHRPAPEDVFERLEDFFHDHDLDRPVIEANSGGTSPTATEHPYGIPLEDRERITCVRGKKSIRIVAEEHKKRIDRTSRAESAYNTNVLRKRSTKLWGSRLEEVTTSQKKPTHTKPLPESPSGGPRREPIVGQFYYHADAFVFQPSLNGFVEISLARERMDVFTLH